MGYKAPPYGRRTAQLKINPFDFFEACHYFTKFSNTDKALAYGIVGGTPQYLMQMDDSLSIEDMSSYMGGVFEEICKQYLWKLLLENKCAVNFSDLGRWWGTNPKTKTQEKVDIMGADKDAALFAECKWTNEKVDIGVLEALIERSSLFH